MCPEDNLAVYALAQRTAKQMYDRLDLCLVVLFNNADGTCSGDGDAESGNAGLADRPLPEEPLKLVVVLMARQARGRVEVVSGQ